LVEYSDRRVCVLTWTMVEASMLSFLTVIALQISAAGAGKDDPKISDVDFRAYFEAARTGRLTIPDDAIEEARRYRYVFVGGFHNERLPGYFAQNARELRARGVPKEAVHFIFPSSHNSVAGNARAARERFEEIACEGPEKLVVIAHSRGSCDTLAFALENPEFVAEHVHALFLIQGPFGGTALADYVVGEGPPMDGRMPLSHRVVGHTLANVEGFLLDHGKHGGLPSLARRASKEFWQDMLEEHSAAIPIVSPKTFYITSEIPASGHRFLQRPIASYLEINFGENDGVVALEDQSLAGVGNVLAVLDAGHTDLTNRFPSGRAAQRLRKAVVDAIIMSVGEEKAAKSRERKIQPETRSSAERTTAEGRSRGLFNIGRR
jgi:pimeloyl-ACP methyl ester carboxylesterase